VRVLIVRLGALGDIVHAIPVAVALRRAYPDARIDWIVSARHREILDLVPVIDSRIAINDRNDAREGMPMLAAVGGLRRTAYDVAIDLQGLIKSALIARASAARRVIGFSRRYTREPLASLLYTERHDPGGEGLFAASETRHVVRVNLGILERLGIQQPRVEFAIEAQASESILHFLNTINAGVAPHHVRAAGPPGRFVLLNAGAAWPNKRWPPDRFAAVARALYDRHGLRSMVLWGPGEAPLAHAVVAAAGEAAIAAPPTSIADLVTLSRAASLMVSGDTGPAHIASAVGTPLVGIYGPTRPERNGPVGNDDLAVSRAASCQCHHLRQCRLSRMCLLDIEVAEVVTAAETRLASEARRG
jgi:lipopolysaccharide heptosyltransferase I